MVRRPDGMNTSASRWLYLLAAATGSHSFVLNSLVEPTEATPVNVILDWKPKP